MEKYLIQVGRYAKYRVYCLEGPGCAEMHTSSLVPEVFCEGCKNLLIEYEDEEE